MIFAKYNGRRRAIAIDEIVFDKTNASPSACITVAVNAGVFAKILSKVRRCLVKFTSDNNVTIRYLLNTNSNYYDDGSAAVLNGTEGDVMVYLPRFYYKFYDVNANKRGLKVSLSRPDATWKESPEGLVGAYYSNLVNSLAYSRSGATMLNISGSSSGKTYPYPFGTERSYATARGAGYGLITYEMYSTIVFLFYAKYRNLNSQAILGTGLDETGDTSTLITSTTTAIGNADTTPASTSRVSFLGIEGIFGAATIRLDNISPTDVGSNVMIITRADGTTRSITMPTAAFSTNGFVKSIASIGGGSEYFDILPWEIGASETTYFCDDWSNNNSTTLENSLIIASHGGINPGGGLTSLHIGHGQTNNFLISSRLAFTGTITESASVVAFKRNYSRSVRYR